MYLVILKRPGLRPCPPPFVLYVNTPWHTGFGASGACVVNNSFHHTSCNMGRMKASHSRVARNSFANASWANLEITGLQRWLEGPSVGRTSSLTSAIVILVSQCLKYCLGRAPGARSAQTRC